MTRQIHVGNVAIGGGAPVSIQSMTNTPTHVKEEVRVDLPRPRQYSDPAFLAIRRRIEEICDDTL